ncbi:methylmalonyl-CoA mutase family protein [Spirosoma foliorum]|uniref:Methylmalonyl-CoA mutase n=1 Tax=Spirosoma foliorum TaxID=2710596 RepID=A0A7G5GR30_9BACT|nr:methylmalonyl-CoA mutase family protein [Spirosoma foliorum]QMW01322.1 methylmalonyl-CoA mutase [Spirosoma foliorum]
MDSLFSSLFPPADQSAWLKQVQKELKDEGAYESLRWHTAEGFIQEPYYTSDALTHLPLASIQETQKQVPGWLNAPERLISNEKADNTVLCDDLNRGADSLVLALSKKPDFAQLLKGIKLSETPVFFRLNATTIDLNTIELVNALKMIAPYQLKGGLLIDTNDATAEVTRLTADSPQFRTICASSHAFHNAGATATQELAFTLASLADSYDRLTDAGLTIDQLVPKTILSVSVGTSYFQEIAKLRALRVLYSRFVSHYSLSISHYQLFIHAQTSTFFNSTATPYTNLLRGTTEAMAAVMGGCDALTVHPYNTVLAQSDNQEFTERIARNVSLLLKDESYLAKVADPSAGSYYIETMTHQLAEAAWTLFLDVEKQGGFAKAFAAGFIASEIDQSYQAKVDAVRGGKVLVGVTKFRFDEPGTQATTTLESVTANSSTGSLPDRRLAQAFE